MFNEVTLGLQALLLVAIYLFLLVAVRVISRDLASAKGAVADMVDVADAVRERVPSLTVSDMNGRSSAASVAIADQVIIGRAPDCDVVLADSFASAHHARVYRDGAAYYVEDLDSTNGTFMLGKRIEAPVKLSGGSQFQIGQTTFKFVP